MKKSLLMKITIGLLYLSGCALLGTGLMLAYRLPPGSQGGHGLTALGLSRYEWGQVHLHLSYIIMALVAAHLYLNWKWVRNVAARKNLLAALVALGIGVIVVLFFVLIPVQESADGARPGQSQKQGQGKQLRQGARDSHAP